MIKTNTLGVKFPTIIFIISLFISATFAQEKKQDGIFAPLIDKIAVKKAQTPQPTPEENKTKRERKVETPKENQPTEEPITKPKSQTVPNYEAPNYPNPPQTETQPTIDYLKEIEKFNKQQELEKKRQDKINQRRMEEFQKQNQSQNEEFPEFNAPTTEPNVTDGQNQPQINNQQITQEQNKKEETQKKEQEELNATYTEMAKWFWLILLFEILQTIGLGVIAFKKQIAKKSSIAMIVGLVITAIVILVTRFVIGNFNLYTDTKPSEATAVPLILGGGIIAVLLLVLGFYTFIVGKISSYIIVSFLPESLPLRLLSVFGIGFSLMAVYTFLFIKSGLGLYGAFAGLGIALIGGIIALVKGVSGGKESLHGSAKFAERKDFKEFENEVEPGAFILAPPSPKNRHGKVVLPRSLSVMHGLILGGSGTGKSRGFFMPNCAEAKNTSLVVTDPKSELWKYTSGFHKHSLRYAPTEPESSFCFNWIPLCEDARMSEICARAIMTAGSTQKTDQFWIDAETAFLSAIFSHTAMTKYPTPLTAYKLFTRQKPEELLQQLLKSPSYVAREQAIIFEQTDARIKGAIVPAVAARMQFMRDANIQLFTSAQLEAPNFGELRHTPKAIYWCLREQDIARLRPLTSLFFTVLLEQIAGEEIPEGETNIPINLMLDEFANIGKIPDFETTISLARGRGVALWLGIQSLSQLAQTYGSQQAQTIMSNCATKIALHGLDFKTAQYVSQMLGETTISHSRSSFNIGMSGVSVGTGNAKDRRQLLTPDEVMRIGENEAIARTSNKFPMILFKGYYDAEPKTSPIVQTLSKVQVEDEEEETLI